MDSPYSIIWFFLLPVALLLIFYPVVLKSLSTIYSRIREFFTLDIGPSPPTDNTPTIKKPDLNDALSAYYTLAIFLPGQKEYGPHIAKGLGDIWILLGGFASKSKTKTPKPIVPLKPRKVPVEE